VHVEGLGTWLTCCAQSQAQSRFASSGRDRAILNTGPDERSYQGVPAAAAGVTNWCLALADTSQDVSAWSSTFQVEFQIPHHMTDVLFIFPKVDV